MRSVERQKVLSGAPWESTYGYSRARVVGPHIFVAGTGPVMVDGSPPPSTAGAQAARCFEIAERALRDVGSSLDDVVLTRFYLTDAADFDQVGFAHGALFRDIQPVCTGVVVAALRQPEWRVEIEVQAIRGAAGDGAYR
jgi:enamine deaminase RidA (YjgF/YER057c/UK114 family)